MRALLRPLAVALVAVLPACTGYSRHGTPETSGPPVDYRAGQSLPPITRSEDYKKGLKGLLRVIVSDDHNRALVGAYVRYKGPVNGQTATDGRGIAEVLLPPGVYKVDIAPCGTTVITTGYQDALATVVAGGQPADGALTGIPWERRFRPKPSVSYSDPPPWRVGQDVRARVRIEDGCTFREAPGAAIPTYRWRPSGNFGFTRAPVMRADAGGRANVDFRCTAPGDGSITISDATNPSDEVNILLAGLGPGKGHHFCERA